MCQSPNMLSDGSLVACRKCEQCRDHRVDDWVGRCIAESKSCVAATSVILTYGRDKLGNKSHERAAILTYSDVQKYFKQLRNRGYPCRYLVTGEMGSKKGRAHWHGIIFWLEKVPEVQTDYGNNAWSRWVPLDEPRERAIRWNKRFHDPCWIHGFSHWVPVQKGHVKGSIRYACKYIHKDVNDAASQSKLAMSKKPPLGLVYFQRRAERFVEEGISPQDRFYFFPDDARQVKTGKPVRFRLRGKVADEFCEHFIRTWNERRPGTHWPHSEFIEEYEDKKTRAEWDRETENLVDRIRPIRRWAFDPPIGYTDREIHASAHGPMVKTPDGPLWYGPDDEGKRAWRNVHPSEAKRLPHKFLPELAPKLTPSGWVEHLSERCVFWISLSSASLGRYKTARTKTDDGKPVWLRSHSA